MAARGGTFLPMRQQAEAIELRLSDGMNARARRRLAEIPARGGGAGGALNGARLVARSATRKRCHDRQLAAGGAGAQTTLERWASPKLLGISKRGDKVSAPLMIHGRDRSSFAQRQNPDLPTAGWSTYCTAKQRHRASCHSLTPRAAGRWALPCPRSALPSRIRYGPG